MSDTSALDLLREELDNDDIQIKVNAIHRFPVIMAVFTPDRIVSDFIPFIQKIIPNEEDEVLLAISEELPHFKTYLDSKKIMNTLPLFQALLGCEETVVRESTVEGLRKLIPSLTDDQVQSEVIPMILNIANMEAFQWKVSACYLVRICYQKAGKEKEKLRSLYFKLCDDETPIIKRTAAKEFGPLCLTMEKEHVSNEMITYYKKFFGETDTVRVTILPALVQLTKLFQNSDTQKLNLDFVSIAADDKSWRVRNELANIYPDFVDYFGSQLNDELIKNISNLIKDSENEVKTSALKALGAIITKIPSDKIQSQIIPALRGLSNESSKETKAKIGGIFGPISKIIGYNAFNTSLGVMMDSLMKDENAEVRLGIAKSMFDIFVSSDGSLLNSTNTLLGTMQKDSQYRIRECVYETLAKLGANYGLDVFKSSIESLFFNYLSDTVASVREVGIQSLKLLIQKFGSAWIISNLVPKLQSFLGTPKLSYLHRMCIIHSLCVCSSFLDPKQNSELIVPMLLKALKDKISNVRFYTIKLVQKIFKNFDSGSKDKIENAIKGLTADEDPDVKYFAGKFLESNK